MKQICRLWRGELPLENAFWNWGVFGGLIINVATTALFLFFVKVDRPVSGLIVGYAFSWPYNIVVLVGVWRSANRYAGEPRHATLVRIVTLVGVILLSVT